MTASILIALVVLFFWLLLLLLLIERLKILEGQYAMVYDLLLKISAGEIKLSQIREVKSKPKGGEDNARH